jgi:hypothetical protein
MRGPASAPENRTHGAKKIGSSRYSDFFNRIFGMRLVRLGRMSIVRSAFHQTRKRNRTRVRRSFEARWMASRHWGSGPHVSSNSGSANKDRLVPSLRCKRSPFFGKRFDSIHFPPLSLAFSAENRRPPSDQVRGQAFSGKCCRGCSLKVEQMSATHQARFRLPASAPNNAW